MALRGALGTKYVERELGVQREDQVIPQLVVRLLCCW